MQLIQTPCIIQRKLKLLFVHSEASDWEAKFYQIQSKYLLLLNELHNPQVGVSESRQEMVSQLLNDVLEAAEARSGPLALSDKAGGVNANITTNLKKTNYDRFGFRIEANSFGGTENGDSVETKGKQTIPLAIIGRFLHFLSV